MSNPFTTRPLAAGDLDPVIALDRKLSGRARRGFFETRLTAALKEPKAFLYIGLTHTGPDSDGALAGYVMARLLRGEFGGDALTAQLDAIGVDPEFQGRGAGRALMRALDKIMRQKGVTELQSQVDWTNHTLTGFFAKTGFTVAPRIVLERGTGELTGIQAGAE
jgi:ribosomal protein S18 acetylase RimI-like enzyme